MFPNKKKNIVATAAPCTKYNVIRRASCAMAYFQIFSKRWGGGGKTTFNILSEAKDPFKLFMSWRLNFFNIFCIWVLNLVSIILYHYIIHFNSYVDFIFFLLLEGSWPGTHLSLLPSHWCCVWDKIASDGIVWLSIGSSVRETLNDYL